MTMLFGSCWHSAYRASWLGKPILDAVKANIAKEGLEAEIYDRLAHEVVDDFQWYLNQPDRGDENLKVLACEEELRVKVGRHELRGTPDLVVEDSNGTVLIPDHKGFTVLSHTSTGSVHIEPRPREDKLIREQVSRQYQFYGMLWTLLHPEKPCYDYLVNLYPMHITAVLNILSNRKGNVVVPQIHRLDLEPSSQDYYDELLGQAIALCDSIADHLNGGNGVAEAMTRFPENESECVGWKGTCQYLDLCRSDHKFREQLLAEAFVAKE